MSWLDYLPPTYQVSGAWWTAGFCFFSRMACESIPDKYRSQLLLQLIALAVGIPAALLIFPDTVARVFAVATGVAAAAGTIQFYDIACSWLAKKVRTILGVATPTEPLQYPPKP